ncbi:hypothetical protein NQ317_010425 [Molorchus minor]|uniref:Uncharacterized protein n=1 Tax=Molorchus minor TaxID=1323400 RepID=A0ABQ9JXI6_9CUCU|nr:hypothetical protein NQ317_010425 [Molorchus minor]
MVKSKPLYLASSFDELQQYVETDVFKDLRRIDKIPHAAHRLLTELFSVQDDQEKVYIIGKRYLKLMDYYFKHQQDKNFCELRYGNEYHQIQKLLADLERELRERYEAQVEEVTPPGSIKESSGYIKPGVYQTPPRDSGYLKPGLYTVAADIDVQTLDYGPSQLFRDLMTEKDLLSANTLGQRLDIDTKDVWNKRDEYDLIVLLDFDTDNFNYSGSRLERLKQCIVEWDFNKTYKHEPVFLKGGFKEFLEWYPSEVSNPQAYLSRTNSEIDELLTMDEVAYPKLALALEK